MSQAISNLMQAARWGRISALRAIAEDSKRSFWAFADQGVVSFGNFGLNLVLARHFLQRQQLGEYGAFCVLMELMFFLNGVQGALVVYPLSVRGAVVDRKTLGQMTARSMIWTALSTPLLMLLMLGTAPLVHVSLRGGALAGLALLCWQLQETTRRGLMAHLRFRAAFLGDAISYAGQVIVIAFFSRRGTLSLPIIFQALVFTSAFACLIQSIQLRLRRTSFHDLIHFGRECWGIGRWILFGNLTNIFSGALFNWNIAYWCGLERLAVYQMLVNLTKPANPLGFAVSTLITPNVAKAHHERGIGASKITAARFTLLGALLLAPYLAMLCAFPKASLALFYGSDSGYERYAMLVPVAAIAVGMVFVAMALGSFLNGVERARESFYGQLIYAGAYLFLVMPITAVMGVAGAVWGWLIAAIVRSVVYLHYSNSDSHRTSIVTAPVAAHGS